MASLNKPGLNCDTAVFRLAVAMVTKANQIGRTICLFIVVILSLDVIKFAERSDMVNVQLSSEFVFGYSAMLAFVAISLAGIPALSMPIRAVIIYITALPQRTVFARDSSGMVAIRTLPTAKMMFVITQLFWRYRNTTPTPIALLFSMRVKRMAIALVIPAVALARTLSTAVIARIAYKTRLFKNWFFAMVANYFNQTFVSKGLIFLLSSAKYSVMDLLAACRAVVVFSPLYSPRNNLDFFVTVGACGFDSVSRWHKNLLLTVDRLLVEGVPSLIGGNENNISLLATGQQFYTFDRGIVPQKGGLLNALGIR